MVGLRDTRIILVLAPGDALRPVQKDVLYAHRGLVVRGTSLGRERESVPSLGKVVSYECSTSSMVRCLFC
jgi:hypothetical protein